MAARTFRWGPALKLAWGRQALNCLGNEKGGFTYESRDGDWGASTKGLED